MQYTKIEGGEFVFYDNFSFLCSQRGISPSAVMKAIGLNKSSASYWKKGTIPSSDTLQKLAAYFDVSVDYLLGKEAPEEGGNVGSFINPISKRDEMSETERRILELFLKMDEPACSALLGYLERLVEEFRNRPPELDAPMDIETQLEQYGHGLLMGIAAAQANYAIRPEDVDIDSITWTPELRAMVENELAKQRRILEEKTQEN